MALLTLCARHGRYLLVLGLIAGIGLPSVAQALRPWLPHLIALALFLAALRIGPNAVLGGLSGISQTARTLAVYQLVAPMLVAIAVWVFGLSWATAALALTLVLAAPPVTGSPNFTILIGRDPAPAMRLLLVGTAAFPLTSVPVLWLSGAAPIADVLDGAVRLILVIAGTVGLAFAIRWTLLPSLQGSRRDALDGLSAIALAVVVIGLMSAIGPTLRSDPLSLLPWMVFVFAVNFGLQALALRFLPVADRGRDLPGSALVAGNRNVALFLIALPPEVVDRLLLFIGCYQFPMYLTPILMRRFLTRV